MDDGRDWGVFAWMGWLALLAWPIYWLWKKFRN